MRKLGQSAFLIFLFVLSAFVALPYYSTIRPSASSQASQTVEPIAYVPILISNPPAYPALIPAGAQINLGVIWKNYSPYVAENLSNVQFLDSNLTAIPAWIESCSIDGRVQTSCTNQSDSNTIWVRIDQSIPINSSIQINLAIYNFTVNLFSSTGNWGEAPNLTSIYGQVDNGANVFYAYSNFNGTSLPSSFSQFGNGTVSVSNGLILKPDKSGGVGQVYRVGVFAPISPITERVGVAFETLTTPISNYCDGVCGRIELENSFSTFLGYGTNSSSTTLQSGYSGEFGADDNFHSYLSMWQPGQPYQPTILDQGFDYWVPGFPILTRFSWIGDSYNSSFYNNLDLYDYNGAGGSARNHNFSLSQVNQTVISAVGSPKNTTYYVQWYRVRAFLPNDGMLDPSSIIFGKLVNYKPYESKEWAGFVISSSLHSVSLVRGSWTVPLATCSAGQNSSGKYVVGIDGWSNANGEYVGTNSYCSKGAANYQAIYCTSGITSCSVIGTLAIHASDKISGFVKFQKGLFNLTLVDKTTKQTFTKKVSVSNAPRDSAMWTVCCGQSTGSNLTNFGSIKTTSDSAKILSHSGSIGYFNNNVSSVTVWQVAMIDSSYERGGIRDQREAQ